MSAFVIPYISKRRNPHRGFAGSREFIPGRETVTVDADGVTYEREMIDVTAMTGPSPYLYEYENTVVECNRCGARFGWKELLDRDCETPNGDDYASSRVCPVCGEWDCCDLEFQK